MLVNIVTKLTFIVSKKNKLLNVIQLNINDPIDPEIVLLGLILEILGPLNILPNIYPPISEAMQVNRRENKTILNWIIFERMKNNEQKINMYEIKNKL